MGRRRALVSSLKKAIICESKENRKKKTHKSIRWFGKKRSIDLDSAAVVPSAHSPTEQVKLMEAENEQNNRNAYSVALADTTDAAEVVRLRGGPHNSNEEIAAIKIQTAFRGYLARRALRGVVRLKSLLRGQSVKRQVSTTLKCMDTMGRLQSEFRFRKIRLSEENSDLQQQIQLNCGNKLEKSRVSMGENWDDSLQSKEKIESNLHNKQEAATRRERALAYAYSHQQTWRKASNQTNMDSNNNPRGWGLLEQWMAARPWETGSAIVPEEVNAEFDSPKSKIQSYPRARKQSHPSTPNSKVARNERALSPRRASVGTDYEAKSVNSVQYRRHNTACSSLRDDDSASSTSGVRSYMGVTESAKAKLRGPSPLGLQKVEKVSSGGSAKKRLSYSGSPAGSRRQSDSPSLVSDVKSNA